MEIVLGIGMFLAGLMAAACGWLLGYDAGKKSWAVSDRK